MFLEKTLARCPAISYFLQNSLTKIKTISNNRRLTGHSSSAAIEDSKLHAPAQPLKAGALARLASLVPHRWLMRVASLQYRFPFLKPFLQAASRRFRNRDVMMQSGVGRGLKFNTAESIAGYAVGISEPDLQAAMQLLTHEGMVVYDIGANVGFFSILLARLVGPTGHVYAFEPVPANARQILYNARLNGFSNIHVDVAAVGGSEGRSAFRVTDFSTTGKLESVGAVGVQTDEIAASIRQLDAIVLKRGTPAPALIKIDTEGAEAEILKGATEVLKCARPVLLIELHNTHEPVISILEAHNYVVHALGSRKPPREAGWNCRIVAAPRELDGFDTLIPQLTDPRLMS
jgi:FkbM family methyltransferase